MLLPRRVNFRCEHCRMAGRDHVLGRVARLVTGHRVLYIRRGKGTLVTDAETDNDFIVICACGEQAIFHGDSVVWKWTTFELDVAA